MRTFRGKEVKEWILITNEYKNEFEKKLNSLMDKYDFADCQFSSCAKTNLAGKPYNGEAMIRIVVAPKLEIPYPSVHQNLACSVRL